MPDGLGGQHDPTDVIGRDELRRVAKAPILNGIESPTPEDGRVRGQNGSHNFRFPVIRRSWRFDRRLEATTS
jgi:hypothetical protein